MENVFDMIDYFSTIATGDGLSPLLVAMGGLFIVVPVVVFAVLVLGAVADLVTPE